MRVRFRGVSTREAALFQGPEGWTEFSPFPEYADGEAATWLAAAIAYGWQSQPRPQRTEIPVNATVPAVAASEVPAVLELYGTHRPGTVKVKVAERGQTLRQDVTRVAAVRAALGPAAHIRVDANGGWDLAQAKTALDALAEFNLEYAEQPVATVDELAELRHWSQSTGPGTPIAADESVRKASDPLRVARAGAADILIVKAQPLGGLARAVRIIEESGLPAVVSSALDTRVGIGMGLALAAALPTLPYACGLGTGSLFGSDVAPAATLRAAATGIDLVLPVERPIVDVDALGSLSASPDRVSWWRARLTRCYALLAAAE